jgi:fucose permease
MKRWGFLFERFEQEYYWWQMVVVGRKILLLLITVFVFSDPYLQVALSCIVLCVNVVLTLAIRPFRDDRHGTMDSLLMLLTMSSFSLTLMNPTDMIVLNHTDAAQESGILFSQLLIIGIFFAICVHYLVADLTDTEYELPTW